MVDNLLHSIRVFYSISVCIFSGVTILVSVLIVVFMKSNRN